MRTQDRGTWRGITRGRKMLRNKELMTRLKLQLLMWKVSRPTPSLTQAQLRQVHMSLAPSLSNLSRTGLPTIEFFVIILFLSSTASHFGQLSGRWVGRSFSSAATTSTASLMMLTSRPRPGRACPQSVTIFSTQGRI